MLSRRHFMAAACREIIPPSGQDLLNVTLRLVEADTTSVLSFAPAARIAAVMLFPQAMTAESEESMRAMTEKLIDRVLALGGSYYLPYRLHARPDQLRGVPAHRRIYAEEAQVRSAAAVPEHDVGEILRVRRVTRHALRTLPFVLPIVHQVIHHGRIGER